MGTFGLGEPHGDASSTDFALVAESRVERMLERHGLGSTKVPSTSAESSTRPTNGAGTGCDEDTRYLRTARNEPTMRGWPAAAS